MLGLLMSLGLFGGAAAKNAYDNVAMKKYTSSYDSNGNHHYCDNSMREYINGEKLETVDIQTIKESITGRKQE